MAVVRCAQGHYYDDEKFSRCPLCGVSIDLSAVFDSGKTVALSSAQTGAADAGGDRTVSLTAAEQLPDDDQKTIGLYSDLRGNDLVTGWIVCVEGPERGRDHRLFHGFNRIGRGAGMQISIEADPSVSRSNQCAVVYDSRGNTFYLVPEKGNQVLLNGNPLRMPAELKAGDLITIGQGIYEFVPFCREGRVWEEK
jgi:hypothetical protein